VSAGEVPACDAAQRLEFELVVLDLMIPRGWCINALQKLRSPSVPPQALNRSLARCQPSLLSL